MVGTAGGYLGLRDALGDGHLYRTAGESDVTHYCFCLTAVVMRALQSAQLRLLLVSVAVQPLAVSAMCLCPLNG